MKKMLSVILAITMLMSSILLLSGCSGAGNVKKIGIVQILEHPSLNTIRESIIKELEANGYKDGQNIRIDYQNAQNELTNLKTISQKFVRNKYDLIIAIATPSAQTVKNETNEIPIIFSACTDPVGAGIVTSLEKPGGNVTGTSDAVSAEMIMELARKITPGIKTIGALYNLSEPNSVSVINDLKNYAGNNGLTVVEATVTSTADIQQAVNSLTGKSDAIFVPIDNTVASAMKVVAETATKAGIPVYVGADSMVKDGGLATYGINYEILGKETAKMAIEVLNGKNPGDIPVKLMTDMDIYINQDTASKLGINIPQDILSEATILN
ncbi:MAG: ABC transporter substrate-binding protein [Clostridiaceae bacterium]|nr:ABC transporter substrate-binding protein [Clostridiaceae bacterium]